MMRGDAFFTVAGVGASRLDREIADLVAEVRKKAFHRQLQLLWTHRRQPAKSRPGPGWYGDEEEDADDDDPRQFSLDGGFRERLQVLAGAKAAALESSVARQFGEFVRQNLTARDEAEASAPLLVPINTTQAVSENPWSSRSVSSTGAGGEWFLPAGAQVPAAAGSLNSPLWSASLPSTAVIAANSGGWTFTPPSTVPIPSLPPTWNVPRSLAAPVHRKALPVVSFSRAWEGVLSAAPTGSRFTAPSSSVPSIVALNPSSSLVVHSISTTGAVVMGGTLSSGSSVLAPALVTAPSTSPSSVSIGSATPQIQDQPQAALYAFAGGITRYDPTTGVPDFTFLPTQRVNHPVALAASLANNTLYAADINTSSIYEVDATTGATIRTIFVPNAQSSAMAGLAISGNSLYVSLAATSTIEAFDATTGAQLAFSAHAAHPGELAISGNVLYTTGIGRGVGALNATTGAAVSGFDFSPPSNFVDDDGGGLTISGNVLYAAFDTRNDAEVSAFDATTGAQITSFPTITGFSQSGAHELAVLDNILYVQDAASIRAYDATTGAPITTFSAILSNSMGIAAIPEPGAGVLAVLGALALLGRRHRTPAAAAGIKPVTVS
jgi:hypothetical protein